jgi:stage V sporulation protein D (sporulation-specific penicillin-binding protein)
LEKDYIAFGQGVSVTPLQLVAAAGAVANGGALLRPHMVEAVGRGERGEVRLAKFTSPPVIGHPISPATAAELTRLLEGVVIEGTGKSAAVPGYRVAGKTGTAQIPVRGGYRGYLPSFVGFAPADRPAVVGLVAIAEPQGNEYYGAQVAAPAFSSIVRQVLLYRGVHPQRDRPTLWMGQAGRVELARLSPARATQARPAVDTDDVLADGDEHDAVVEGDPGAAAATPAAAKAPVNAPVTPRGGRPHAAL